MGSVKVLELFISHVMMGTYSFYSPIIFCSVCQGQ